MENLLKCPKCTKEMRSLGGYPQCITCGYEDYTTKIVEESISSPEALRGNLYIAHYRGLTLVNKDVIVKIKLENVVSNKDSEPKLIPLCPKCQNDMTVDRAKERVVRRSSIKWYQCNLVTSHIIFLNFEKLFWSDSYGY